MIQEVLKNFYGDDTRCLQIANTLVLPNFSKIFLKGLHGSAAAFVFTASSAHTDELNHVIILNEAEDAAYFHNTIENISGALDIFYFPSSFKTKKNYRLLNASHVMLRTEALTKLASGGGNSVRRKILITYPEALFEKVVVSKTLSENIIHIKTADTLDIPQLLLTLDKYGFERSDFVYEPGQYAMRGGIFDIYSFGNEKPYRIELFGNEVDSIRIIDPETQLSERKLLQVSIIPNVDTQFINEERVSLFDFLPSNTAIWMEDHELCIEKLKDNEEELKYYLQYFSANPLPQNTEDGDKLLKKNISILLHYLSVFQCTIHGLPSR